MKLPLAPRIHLEGPLAATESIELPAAQARHVQVLRLQPGDALTLFDGSGGEWQARVEAMSRTSVSVRLERHVPVDRELRRRITLALGMPANERMDALIEKATELGANAIQPLMCERSVLRLSGDRAAKRLVHWRGVVVAASEQSGRTRLPQLHEVRSLREWLASMAASPEACVGRIVLSPGTNEPLHRIAATPSTSLLLLSGPEGGLTDAELDAARARGFVPASLGSCVLRADTAPLAALAWCALSETGNRLA